MSQRLLLSLPIPITENHAYYYVRGKKILNKRAKDWMRDAEEIVTKEILKQHWVCTEKTKVIVEVTTYWQDRRLS